MNSAAVIIAFDINVDKLDIAIKLGATHVVNVQNENVLSRIMEITSKNGLDYAIECAGKRESMEMAFKSIRDKGGLCVIAGNLPQGEQVSIDPFDLIKGKQIIGTWGGGTQPDKDIPLFVDWYLKGRLDLNHMVARCYKLDEINEAFNNFSQGIAGRVLINMASG
jgi:S-(hydroxymethyl)glutathione dehydrogenase/alcohol dehydrogenase